jgi:hypothetical protein
VCSLLLSKGSSEGPQHNNDNSKSSGLMSSKCSVQTVDQIPYVLLRCFAELHFKCQDSLFILGLFSDTFRAAYVIVH